MNDLFLEISFLKGAILMSLTHSEGKTFIFERSTFLLSV